MKLTITTESLEAAKQELTTSYKHNRDVLAAFTHALDALCVSEVDGWVEVGPIEFTNGLYTLKRYGGLKCWTLFKSGGFVADLKGLDRLISEAQAWADAEIEKYEAGSKECPTCKDTGRVDCPYCTKGLHTLECPDCSMGKSSKPKPFGPGTRLRAKNGDELMVFEDPRDDDLGVANLTTNQFCIFSDEQFWMGEDELHAALLAAGATVQED